VRKAFVRVQSRHFRCMDAKHRSEQCVLFNFKSGNEIGQTRRGNPDILCGMIIGAHFLLHSRNPEADRAFFRDILGFQFVDVGHGWLIFGMSPAEAAIHLTDGAPALHHAGHEMLGGVLYLMCDDLDAFIASLQAKNVRCTEIQKADWGIVTTIPLPSGGSIGLYQPKHPTALHFNSK
jgi:hypothetical protein